MPRRAKPFLIGNNWYSDIGGKRTLVAKCKKSEKKAQQALVGIKYGLKRILIANQLVGRANIRSIARSVNDFWYLLSPDQQAQQSMRLRA